MKLEEPKVHIIVPFISLNSYVIECVENILKLDYSNFLLILLPDTPIVLPEKYAQDKRIRELVTGNENISKKRNMGINQFPNCDYFAFIDSDAYPRSDWLNSAVMNFKQEIWAVGGPNTTPSSEPISQRVVGNASKSMLVSGTYCFRKRIAKNRYCNHLPTCNLIVSREAINKLCGFNEKLFTGEDIDLCARILQHGKKILYLRDAVVFHHNRRLWLPFLKQRITWGLSVFKVMKENPSISNAYLFIPLVFILFLAALAVMSFWHNIFLYIFLGISGLFSCAVFIESLRWSEKIIEIPGTFASLFLGNLSPGIGSLWAIVRVSKDHGSTKKLIKKIYQNN